MIPIGQTRTIIKPNHAFIAPDSYVWAGLPGWTGDSTQGAILISPQMRGRPGFTQYLVNMGADGRSGAPLPGVQRFVYMLNGATQLDLDGDTTRLDRGSFAYIPADAPHTITADADEATLLIFEKTLSTVAPCRPHRRKSRDWRCLDR